MIKPIIHGVCCKLKDGRIKELSPLGTSAQSTSGAPGLSCRIAYRKFREVVLGGGVLMVCDVWERKSPCRLSIRTCLPHDLQKLTPPRVYRYDVSRVYIFFCFHSFHIRIPFPASFAQPLEGLSYWRVFVQNIKEFFLD